MSEVAKLEFTPAVFDPNKEQLHAIAAEVATITADPSKMTKEDFELVNTTKNKLVKARTAIQRRGKEVREEAVKFQRDVIAYEKELIAIIEPEEERLKEIERGAKEYAMKEERKKTLPEFRAKLDTIGDGVEVDDAFLLSLDPNGRDAYYNERLGAKLEADKAKAAEEEAAKEAARKSEEEKLAKEREAIENEKRNIKAQRTNTRIQRIVSIGYKDVGTGFDLGDGAGIWLRALIEDQEDAGFEITFGEMRKNAEEFAEKNRIEDERKRQAEIKQAQEAAAQAERERLAKEEAERKEAAQREAEQKAVEEAERSRAEAYQKFLNENSYNADTDITTFENGVTTLYRKVATYNHN